MELTTVPEFKRIGLFGGSFDPPHLAHVQVAQMAYEHLSLERVCFIPCRQSPHKQDFEPASARERWMMLQAACSEMAAAEVIDLELQREGLSYSIDTVMELQQQYPAAQLYWIMGSDQWEVLDSWYRATELAELLEFIVFPRPNKPLPQAGKVLHVIDASFDISSSRIRAAIQQGEDVGEWLHADVQAYIREKGLYQ